MSRPSLACTAALAAALCVAACASKPTAPTIGASPAAEAAPQASQTLPEPVPSGGLQPASQAELEASAGARVFFAVDSHALSGDALATLDRQAAWLARYSSVRVVIAGNADERGTREYNLALGGRRASAARDYLVARGVASSRIRTVSYGKERPIDARSNEEGWARNRNAHTVLMEIVGASW